MDSARRYLTLTALFLLSVSCAAYLPDPLQAQDVVFLRQHNESGTAEYYSLADGSQNLSNNAAVYKTAEGLKTIAVAAGPRETQTQSQKKPYIIQFEGEPVLAYKTQLEMSPPVEGMQAIVAEYEKTIQQQQQTMLSQMQVTPTRTYNRVLNAVAAELTAEEYERVSETPGVKKIFEDRIVHVMLNESVPLIKATLLWQLNDTNGDPVTGENITIAIIDTGVDYTHPDLGGCLGAECKVTGGYDVVNQDDDPMDDHGHGTHCAAIAASNGVLRGVAPDAKITAYKVLSSGGSGTWSQVVEGIERAVDPDQNASTDDGADVLSMSLGGSGDPDDVVSQAVDTAVDAGAVVVVAAGNSGPGNETIGSPGCARKALTVGATDKNDKIASFSSRGPTSIGETKPDVVAPGVTICAAQWDDAWSSRACYDDEHTAISGTSMATPHVAGAVALLLQVHPEWTPTQVKNALKDTGVDLGYDANTQGAGRIDVLASSGLTMYARVDPVILNYNVVVNQTVWSGSSIITITNLANESILYTVTVNLTQAGINAMASNSSVLIPASGEAELNVSVSVNISQLASGRTYAGTLNLESSLQAVTVPIRVKVGDRATVSPDSIDFGVSNPLEGSWGNATLVTVVNNLTDTTLEFNVTVDFNESGVEVTVDKENITLSPAGNQTLNLSVSVNNTLLPDGAYQGSLNLTSPLQNLSTSFSFTKGHTMELSFSEEPWVGLIHNRNNESRFFVRPELTQRLLLSQGVYDIITLFTSNVFVVEEGINVTGFTSVLVNRSEAANQITIDQKDKDGGNVYSRFGGLSIIHNESGYGITLSGGFGLRRLVSNVSSNTTIDWQTYYRSGDIYIHNGNVTGVSSNVTVSNNPADFKHITNTYHINYNTTTLYQLHWIAHLGERSGIATAGSSTEGTISAPYTQEIYVIPLPHPDFYWNSHYQELYEYTGAGFDWWYAPLLYRTPYIMVNNTTDFEAQAYPLGSKLFESNESVLHVGLNPELWYGRFGNSLSQIRLKAYNGSFIRVFYTQYFDFKPHSNLPYTIYKDGVYYGNGTFEGVGWGGSSPVWETISLNSTGVYSITVNKNYSIKNTNYSAQVNASFNLNQSDKDPPSLTKLNLFAGGSPSDTIRLSSQNTLEVEVDPIGGTINSFNASYDVGGGWAAMNATNTTQNAYNMTIPTAGVTAGNYSIKLMASDNNSNNLTYVFQLPTNIKPDLMVNSSDIRVVDVNASDFVGTVNATIRNIGESNTSNITIQFYDGDPQDGGIQIGENQSIGFIAEGGSASASVLWETSISTHTITVWVDPANEISEGDEANNIAHMTYYPIRITGGYSDEGVDATGDGQYDYLRVNISLNVTNPGEYQISGGLYDNTGSYITSASNTSDLDAGVQTLSLHFKGMTVYQTRKNGPYALRYLRLYSTNTSTYLETLQDPYTTSTYNYTNFTRPPAEFTREFTDYVVDSDADGRYDYLIVNATVNVSSKNEFRVDGYLYDSSNDHITGTTNSTMLDASIQTIQLIFDGRTLFQHGVNGPYWLRFYLYDADYNHIDSAAEGHETAAYNYTDFEQPPAEFNSSFNDYGIDLDADDLYDKLALEVGVNVRENGTYRITGYLYNNTSGGYIETAANTTTLSAGNRSINLFFDGIGLYRNQRNGTYALRYLRLYDAEDNQLGYNYSPHTTNTYNYTQFARPKGQFTGEFSEHPLDFDSDGLYDNLVLGVYVNVTKNGSYILSSGLYSDIGGHVDSASNQTSLTPGVYEINLSFDGKKLQKTMRNGSYNLRYLYLYDLESNRLDYLSLAYVTSPYNYTQFEMPDAKFSLVYADGGVDSDSDGLYDNLVVSVGVIVSIPGVYYTSGHLYGSADNISYTRIGYTSNRSNLSTGSQTVNLSFRGIEVRGGNLNGSYLLRSLYLYNESWSDLDGIYEAYATGNYNATDFEQPTTELNDTYSETPLDLNGDGEYDYLVIGVGVTVRKNDNYTLYGYLYNETGGYVVYARNTSTLSVGNHTLNLYFDGMLIRDHGSSGAHHLRSVRIYDPDGVQMDYENSPYNTSSYNHTQFQSAREDEYEPDDAAENATLIPTNGSKQQHNFHTLSDQDWIRFNATGGVRYRVETLELMSKSDTYLRLYDTDARVLLRSDDDSGEGKASQIVYTISSSGVYYAMVRHYESQYGPLTGYNVSVAVVTTTTSTTSTTSTSTTTTLPNPVVRVTSFNTSKTIYSLGENVTVNVVVLRVDDEPLATWNGTLNVTMGNTTQQTLLSLAKNDSNASSYSFTPQRGGKYVVRSLLYGDYGVVHAVRRVVYVHALHNRRINLTANQSLLVNATETDSVVELSARQNLSNVNFTVALHYFNPVNASLGNRGLRKYWEYNTSQNLTPYVNSIQLKIYFTDSELESAYLNESTLGVYWLNASSEWEILNSSVMDWVLDTGLNAGEDFVWANVTHFSVYTIGGVSTLSTANVTLRDGWNLISPPVAIPED